MLFRLPITELCLSLQRKSPIEEDKKLLPVQSSQSGIQCGDTDFNYSWSNTAKASRESQKLPVVDCGDGPSGSWSHTTDRTLANPSISGSRGTSIGASSTMPIPFLQAPLREEDVERMNGKSIFCQR
jgi:hypothetical protein